MTTCFGLVSGTFVGPIVPLVTAIGSSFYLDHRSITRNAPSSKNESSDCVARTALLLFRGFGAGITWSIASDGYILVNLPDIFWKEHLLKKNVASTKFKEITRLWSISCVRNCLGFGSFLGIFGGISCSLERIRGKNDFLNNFCGGFIAGLAISSTRIHNPRQVITSAAVCVISAIGFHSFVPSSDEEK
jgi:hypothetical protein